jgi:hypothetical protein
MELGFAGGARLLCDLLFLTTLAMQKRQRRSGIISLSFFHSSIVIYFGVNGEAGKTCPEVEG